MSNLLVNTRDQKFLLYEQIGIDRLFGFEKYVDYSREVVDMVLSEAEKDGRRSDCPDTGREGTGGAQFRDGKAYAPRCFHGPFKTFAEAGWICATKDPAVGGQNLPISVHTACRELFAAAHMAFSMYAILTTGAAGLIETYGTEKQKNTYMNRCMPVNGPEPCVSPSRGGE